MSKRTYGGRLNRWITDKEKAITRGVRRHPDLAPALGGTLALAAGVGWAEASAAAGAIWAAEEGYTKTVAEVATLAKDVARGLDIAESDVRAFTYKFHSTGNSTSSTGDYRPSRALSVGGSSDVEQSDGAFPPLDPVAAWTSRYHRYLTWKRGNPGLEGEYDRQEYEYRYSDPRPTMSNHTRGGAADPPGSGAVRPGRAAKRGTRNPLLAPATDDMDTGDPASHAQTRRMMGGGHKMFVTRQDLLANPYRSLKWSVRSPFPPVLLTTLYREYEFSIPVMPNTVSGSNVTSRFGMAPLIRVFCNTLGSESANKGYGAWPFASSSSAHVGSDTSHHLRDLELYNWNSAGATAGGLAGVLVQSGEKVPWQQLLAKIYSRYSVYGSRIHITSTNHMGDEDAQDMENAISPLVRWNLNCALNTASTGTKSTAGDPTDKYPDYLKHTLNVQPSYTTFGQVCITNYGEKEMGGFNAMHPLHHKMTRQNRCHATRTQPSHTELSGTWNLKHHEGYSVGDVIEGRDPFFIEQDDTASKNPRNIFSAATADSATVPHTDDAGTAWWDIFPTPIAPDSDWVNTYKNALTANDLMAEAGLVSATTDAVDVLDAYTAGAAASGTTSVAGPWMNLKIMVEYDVALFDMVPDATNPGQPAEKEV